MPTRCSTAAEKLTTTVTMNQCGIDWFTFYFFKESLKLYIFPLFGSFQVQQWKFSQIGQYLGVPQRLKVSIDTHYEAKNTFFHQTLKNSTIKHILGRIFQIWSQN